MSLIDNFDDVYGSYTSLVILLSTIMISTSMTFALLALIFLSSTRCSTTYKISCQHILHYYNIKSIYSKIIEIVFNNVTYYETLYTVKYNSGLYCYITSDLTTYNITTSIYQKYVYKVGMFEECDIADNDIKEKTNGFDNGVIFGIISASSLVLFIIIWVYPYIFKKLSNLSNTNVINTNTQSHVVLSDDDII